MTARRDNIPGAILARVSTRRARGEFLRRKREEQNLSQAAVGRLLGHPDYRRVCKWESGRAEVPISSMAHVLDVYGVEGSERQAFVQARTDAHYLRKQRTRGRQRQARGVHSLPDLLGDTIRLCSAGSDITGIAASIDSMYVMVTKTGITTGVSEIAQRAIDALDGETDDASSAVRAKALLVASTCARMQGRYREAIAHAKTTCDYGPRPDPAIWMEATVAHYLALLNRTPTAPLSALEVLSPCARFVEESLRLSTKRPHFHPCYTRQVGIFYRDQIQGYIATLETGDDYITVLRQGIRHLLLVTEEETDPVVRWLNVHILTRAYAALRDLQKAEIAYSMMRELMPDPAFSARAKDERSLGAIALARGDHSGAIAAYGRAINHFEASGDPNMSAILSRLVDHVQWSCRDGRSVLDTAA